MKIVNKKLDKFYTKPEIASQCINYVYDAIKELNFNADEFLEPSAGSGSFSNILIKDGNDVISYDIHPEISNIIQSDFLKIPRHFSKNRVIIGNPPFGKRSSLAIKFVEQSIHYGYIIAFILPVQFRKWSVQNKLPKQLKLFKDYDLPEDSFLFDGKSYKVRCCFQIWVHNFNDISDLRLKIKPITEHKDFDMFLYNNTKTALKYFDFEFDFAVPRQGFQDYSRRETDPEKCEKSKQWILFKAHTKKTLDILMNLDYNELSKLNTSIPGFGKTDVINLYNGVVNNESTSKSI
jgi:hypothetical protein